MTTQTMQHTLPKRHASFSLMMIGVVCVIVLAVMLVKKIQDTTSFSMGAGSSEETTRAVEDSWNKPIKLNQSSTGNSTNQALEKSFGTSLQFGPAKSPDKKPKAR